MNRINLSDLEPSDFDEIVHQACRYFELAWHDNNQYRIEQSLDYANSLVRNSGVRDADYVYDRILTELIHVEMSLRAEAGSEFRISHYLARFPDCKRAVENAWSNLKKKQPDSTIFSDWIAKVCPDGEEEPNASSDSKELERQFEIDPSGHQTIPSKLGPYDQIEPLASGGFGVVCKAQDSRTGRVVALKFPHRELIQSDFAMRLLVNESRRAETLIHPGIVKVFGIEFIDGYVVMIQQFVDGRNLRESMQSTRTIPEIVSLVSKLAEAIAYSHQMGIIHRDLKPSNILLNNAGEPSIADFGLALQNHEQRYALAEQCGTPSYMSPQQVRGHSRDLDGRTDIWSLGVIFYELLTGAKPFCGVTQQEVFEKIQAGTLKPPREINPNIDRELQRICLYCLQKTVRDRYLTADELAADLQTWSLEKGDVGNKGHSDIVPKGLAAYDRTDASFFVELLPGVRDRHGLPSSLRFWVNRICHQMDDEQSVPIGVIYGPSGSGKSSFIKAGLIPLVEHQAETIYVESTQNDTEVRLLKALKRTFPGIPDGIALPDILAGLRIGQWRSSAKKVLIILDQFEQKLSKNENFGKAQLTRALRYCDGEQLQCMLLVRDEFWLTLSRYFDALGYDLIEGGNSQLIDLFDSDHAKFVLKKFGQAYDKLPQHEADMTDDQVLFLKKAVEQLSNNDYVVCIHLTVFAEIFLNRAWSTQELKAVGGVSGVGEKYLASIFGPAAKTSRNRNWSKSAEAVFQELLPAANSGIRGAMKSQEQLRRASELHDRPADFKEFLGYLEKDVKLITRTNPDVSGTLQASDDKTGLGTHYQLTHDYLVPSIRQWLSSELSKTYAGRAKLRLKELGALVTPGGIPQYLPSHFEWMVWGTVLSPGKMNAQEKEVMSFAKRKFWTAFLRYSLLIILMGSGLTFLYVRQQSAQNAKQAISDILGQEISNLPAVVEEAIPHRQRIESFLVSLSSDQNAPPEHVRRANLALLPFRRNVQQHVIKSMLRRESTPEELTVGLQILAKHSDLDTADLKSVLNDSTESQVRRFRSLVILANQSVQSEIDGESFAAMVSSQLSLEPTTKKPGWVQLLEPLKVELIPTFKEILSNTTSDRVAESQCIAMQRFLDPEDRHDYFTQLLVKANDIQLDSICRSIEQNRESAEMIKSISKAINNLEPGLETSQQQANLAVASARLGYDSDFIDCQGGAYQSDRPNGPATRSYAITRAGPKAIDFSILQQTYLSVQNNSSMDSKEKASITQGLLLSISLHLDTVHDNEQQEWIFDVAKEQCLTSRDPGCFAAGELILRKRGDHSVYRQCRKQRYEKSSLLGDVWINSNLQPFSILRPSAQNGLQSPIAVSMYEITKAEFGKVAQGDDPEEIYAAENFFEVVKYCQGLDKANGSQAESPFLNFTDDMDLESLEINPNKTGYRVLSKSDWRAVNAEIGGVSHMGLNNELGDYFAISLGNAVGAKRGRVGTLFPNRLGLFDIYGNAHEICFEYIDGTAKVYVVGSDSRQSISGYSAEREDYPGIRLIGSYEPAIRLVRTWPPPTMDLEDK